METSVEDVFDFRPLLFFCANNIAIAIVVVVIIKNIEDIRRIFDEILLRYSKENTWIRRYMNKNKS